MKILLIQLKRAGDVILTTPLASVIKCRWPAAQVDFLVDKASAPLLENNPSVDNLRIYDRERPWRTFLALRSQHYDHVFDFQSSPRSAIAAVASGASKTAGYRVPFWGRFYSETTRRPGNALSVTQGKVALIESVLGPFGKVPEPEIVLRPEERDWAKNAMIEPAGRTIVGLVPTHRHSSRRWHAESFAALAEKFEKTGCAVWLFWGPGEREYTEGVQRLAPGSQLIPPTSLRQMAALFSRCEWVVSNDNGPMHLAAAVSVPTVTVYGPTDPAAWNPGGSRHKVVQAEGVSCLRCNLNVCPFGHECMTQLSPESVFSACRDFVVKV